jgi:hypothetical protein
MSHFHEGVMLDLVQDALSPDRVDVFRPGLSGSEAGLGNRATVSGDRLLVTALLMPISPVDNSPAVPTRVQKPAHHLPPPLVSFRVDAADPGTIATLRLGSKPTKLQTSSSVR